MTIAYTIHALERMKTRGINKNEVFSCLSNPDKIEMLGKIAKAVKKIDDKTLIVYFRRENEIMIVITAYKTSKTQKYMK